MRKLKNYPLNDTVKIDSIAHMIDLCVKDAGDKTAFMYKTGRNDSVHTVTYKEFADDVLALEKGMAKMGIKKTHISILSENSYKWINVFISVLKSDSVFIPIDKELPFEDVLYVASHSDCRVLFFSAKYKKYIPEIMEKIPEIEYYIGLDEEEDDGKILSYKKLVSIGREESDDILSYDKDYMKMKMIVYTSGTTGLAKGVMLSEHNLTSMIYNGLRVATVYSKCLSVLPYHHTYEAVAGILVSMHNHSCICINENMKAVVKNLNLYKPDYMFVVPAILELFHKRIWANAKEGKKDKLLKIMIPVSNFLLNLGIDVRKKLFSSIHNALGGNFKSIMTGGAPVNPDLGDFFYSIGIPVVNGYGITECSPLISGNRERFNDWRTGGMVVPCLDIKFDDIQASGDGEIVVKGDTVMLGYYKDEEKTKEVLKDGWFSTGDYGRMSDLGQLIITGRKKNLIVLTNGKNIFPEEIENYVLKVPYVAEAIVKSAKDKNGETALIAEVFLNADEVKKLGIENVEKKLREDITSVCEPLPKYKKIAQIEIRDTEFEKTSTRKIKR
ncbi:MAG: AMP-binding protein [Clostridia bacterium]|nr:AMP-binding protein [Clostridia bacterium]